MVRRRELSAPATLSLPDPSLEVLHPPLLGPEGNENSRSLVLMVRSAELSILLTGDLEGTGLERVLGMRRIPVDVLMAPHHGSKTANTPELAKWASPALVVSAQGAPRGNPKTVLPYEGAGAHYVTTWKHGAITIRKDDGRWIAESYLTKQTWEVRKKG